MSLDTFLQNLRSVLNTDFVSSPAYGYGVDQVVLTDREIDEDVLKHLPYFKTDVIVINNFRVEYPDNFPSGYTKSIFYANITVLVDTSSRLDSNNSEFGVIGGTLGSVTLKGVAEIMDNVQTTLNNNKLSSHVFYSQITSVGDIQIFNTKIHALTAEYEAFRVA